mmetsp:Transcript_2608/g.5975  ORF Transcript_2608/g.5975 Transcript_2608/m.5975 type:complete len:544 (+) Transcript_2608:299-1930(+)|eukprot:CAMPEP_0114516196 /NCGR_PEP_ID=MMETSP0109-20121206/17198_1 /TAXON_ID=29199 /ORGANISM="Chlorarachnion reptans, Strain CCCM449" /LENGTH=543 /DNA_ID=CAMNT_0001696567 /DNA_START=246 /DNA_END=1877 /DNA_ORIENTATION=+
MNTPARHICLWSQNQNQGLRMQRRKVISLLILGAALGALSGCFNAKASPKLSTRFNLLNTRMAPASPHPGIPKDHPHRRQQRGKVRTISTISTPPDYKTDQKTDSTTFLDALLPPSIFTYETTGQRIKIGEDQQLPHPYPSKRDPYIPFGAENEKLPKFVTALHKGNLHNTPSEEVCLRRGQGGEELAIPQARRYVSRDWLHILREMPRSQTLSRIRGIVLVQTIWALVLAMINRFIVQIPQLGSPALVTPALGLLLVFRTNAAYNRFWEGCRLWEKLTDRSRNLIRYASLYHNAAGTKKVQRIGRLLSALALVLKQHLTHPREEETKFVEERLLDPEDVELLGRVQNRPLFLTNLLAAEVHAIPDVANSNSGSGFSSRERLSMIRIIDEITDVIGACERIVQTPVPLNYARHTSRFLTFWCLTLPLALVGDMGMAVVPVTALVVWAMYGIQEIGLMIEEPFRRSLSLHVFCNTIYHDVQETLAHHLSFNQKVKQASEVPVSKLILERRCSSSIASKQENVPLPPGITKEMWGKLVALGDEVK